VPGPIDDPTPRVRFEEVDHLPDGRLVAQVEYEHETVFAVVTSGFPDTLPEFFRQMESVTNASIATGAWGRRPLAPPGPAK
jgi:hypothetical protein